MGPGRRGGCSESSWWHALQSYPDASDTGVYWTSVLDVSQAYHRLVGYHPNTHMKAHTKVKFILKFGDTNTSKSQGPYLPEKTCATHHTCLKKVHKWRAIHNCRNHLCYIPNQTRETLHEQIVPQLIRTGPPLVVHTTPFLCCLPCVLRPIPPHATDPEVGSLLRLALWHHQTEAHTRRHILLC